MHCLLVKSLVSTNFFPGQDIVLNNKGNMKMSEIQHLPGKYLQSHKEYKTMKQILINK